MNDKNIFIHILKTGGTTINTAMNNSEWQTQVDFNYRHIQKKTKCSNSGDIFNPDNFQKYREYNIFMMVREPVDRLVSEYYFIKEREGYMNLIKDTPTSFEEYINNPQTGNYMTGFLLGKRMYSQTSTTRSDLDKVISAIESIPIHVGIFEQFSDSLDYFGNKTGIKWSSNIEVKRMTFQRPKKEEIDSELRQLILKNNNLDKELYDYCLKRFEKQRPKKVKQKIEFVLSKHNHIISYTKTLIYFEFCVLNKNYLKQNNLFFRKLNTFMHGKLKITDGKEFAATWNATFEEAVNRTYTNTDFAKSISKALKSDSDPLQATINIGSSIDHFFTHNSESADKYYKALEFDVSMVQRIKPILNLPKEKSSFFARLFTK
ncbi:MAG: sulfotransferase family 2 domain-containing protein [Flavobacteriales bacterium]|nr:sulfotransferase family 2 domain-containing protein [Flavobacteriales bacterium]